MSTTTLAVRVAHKQAEADGICSLSLVAADGGSLPAFSAGAHIDLHLPGGLVRPYSLCNAPAERERYQIAVLREPASRGGSVAVHERLAEGSTLQIGAPRNAFALATGASSHLLLAGGIGITPLLAMAEALHAAGEPFRLHYTARSAGRMAFRERLTHAAYAAAVQLHTDDGPAAQRLDLAQVLGRPSTGRHLYVCGPTGFIQAVLDTARQQGWPEAQLHCEHFGAAPAPADANSAAFEVQVASSGQVLVVPPGRSITQVLSEAGVFISTSCEQGVCGTCLTRVLDGVPEHHDQYLTPEEQAAGDQCLPCCARARSARLVLDL